MVIALITLLGSLVSLGVWWLRRKKSPTPEERIDDSQQSLAAALQEMERLRSCGDHAGAEFIRRRLLRHSGIRAGNNGDRKGE